MLRQLALTISGLVAALAIANTAKADCGMEDRTVEEAYSESVMVFTGEIIRSVAISDEDTGWTNYEYEVRIEKNYKGAPDRALLLKSYGEDSYRASAGEEHLFFLSDKYDQSPYEISACGRNSLVSEAQEDITWLDQHASQRMK